MEHCRIPAFGEWNYGQYDYGADGWTPLTPCFDAVALRMTNALPVSKPEERTRARGNARRRRRIPAFGEWNHNANGDANGSWPATATPFFDLATAHKPPQTERRNGDGGAEAKLRRSAEAHGRRQSKVADSEAYAVRKSCFTVAAKAVDDDLYGVPADVLYQKPARKRGWLRILLMAGCFCPRGRTCMA